MKEEICLSPLESNFHEIFLSNPENKQQFINMLGGVLTVSEFDVKYCVNDADTTIVEKSLDILNWNNVVLIADDTDIFVLLMTQLKGDLGQHCLYLKQQASKKMINISSLINCIPDEKKNTLLLNHAMSAYVIQLLRCLVTERHSYTRRAC